MKVGLKLFNISIIFSFTCFHLFAQQPFVGLRDVSMQVASIRKTKAEAAGFTEEAQTIANEMAVLEQSSFVSPIIPIQAIGFNPIPTVVSSNPHIASLYEWAENYLLEPDPDFNKSTPTNAVFPTGGNESARELGQISERLIWLTLSPVSRYQFHPVLCKRLFLIVSATADDYILFGTGGGPDISPLDDWFAAAFVSYSWKIVATSFAQYLPPLLKKRLEDAGEKMGSLFYQRSLREMGSAPPYSMYCNRDISFAEILIHLGQFRNNATWLDRGNLVTDLILSENVLYPDGAYSYIGNQNEVSNYHGATTNSLAKLYSVTNRNAILTGITRAQNYELLNIEEGFVNEFYHVPAWKTQWNGINGSSSASLFYISKLPQLKPFYKRRFIESGVSNIPVDIAYYHDSIPAAPTVTNYLVYDRNIQGPKRRINDFSFGITTRKVSLPSNIGALTLAGAMTTRQGSNSRKELDAALMSIHAKVHTNAGNDSEWDKWAYMMGNMDPKVTMSKSISAVSTQSRLYRQTAGPAGHLSNWDSFQQWITLPDRMIGLIEVFPRNNTAQNAYQIDGRIKLGYGRSGTLSPKTMEVVTPGVEYNYGNLKVILHQHDFTTVDTASAGVIRDYPQQATEIRLRYDLSNNGTTLVSYPGTTRKFFIAEIRYKTAVGNVTVERFNSGNVKGLIVTSGNNKYSTFRNLGTTTATFNVSPYIVAGNITKVHYPRTDQGELSPTPFTGTNLSIPANEQRVLISSNSVVDNQKSWENYSTLLGQLPGINIESDQPTNGICTGDLMKFTALTANEGVNTSFQWALNDVAVPGATQKIYTSSSLSNGQKVNCTMTTTLPDGSLYVVKSNDIIVSVSTRPSTPIVSVASPSVFVGNTILLTSTATGATKFNWNGPNNFKSSFQNPIVTFATMNESGGFSVTAENKGCFSLPSSVTITTSDTHIWRGTSDSNFGNDSNWDFGYPKLNIGHVRIQQGPNKPIVNASSSFSVPSMEIVKDAPLDVTGFFSVGNAASYFSKVNFRFLQVESPNLVGKSVSGTYEFVGNQNSGTFEFKWYRSDNVYGNNAILIGTSKEYTITTLDVDKFIAFSVVKRNATGGIETVKTSEYRRVVKVNVVDNQPIQASAIYSLRKVKNSYLGALIKVRRDRDNQEIDIMADDAGYLDLDALHRFALYGNVFVSVWYDQSGNGLHAVQVDKNKQPFIVKNGILIKNNFLPSLEFIGTDVLDVPSSTKLDAPGGFALFVTCKQFSDHPSTEFRSSVAYRSLSGANGNGGSMIGTYGFRNIFSSSNTRQVLGFMRNSSNGILSNGTVSISNYRDFSNQSIQLTNYCNGSGTGNNVISVNNNQFSLTETLALAASPINGSFSIGNRNTVQNNVHFTIGEVILFNQPLSAAQRDEIEKNLVKLL